MLLLLKYTSTLFIQGILSYGMTMVWYNDSMVGMVRLVWYDWYGMTVVSWYGMRVQYHGMVWQCNTMVWYGCVISSYHMWYE